MKFLDLAGLSYLVDKMKEKFVKKESGKGLSSNDFTDNHKKKVDEEIPDELFFLKDKLENLDLSEGIDLTPVYEALENKIELKDLLNKGSLSDEEELIAVTNEETRQVNASYVSTANNDGSQVNASFNSTVSGMYSQVNTSFNSIASGGISQVNASVGVENNEDYTSAWGFDENLTPSTENRKIELHSKNGTVKASGSITGNSSFADFAEYMESLNGEQIPLGTIVSLKEGQKIGVAEEGEFPVGIISATAGIVLNAQGFEWKDRYLYDRYGQPIMVDKYIAYYEDENGYEDRLKLYHQGEDIPEIGDIVDNKKVSRIKRIKAQQLNSEYDTETEYIPRESRPEWNVVGMKGQIYVNIDDTVKEHGFIKVGKDGIATDGVEYNKYWQVMEITTPYDENLGFGIARVLI